MKDKVAERYREALRSENGGKAVLWGSDESQRRRFQVLTEGVGRMIRPNETFTLLDVGCGTGDYYHFLQGTPLKGGLSYLGVDALSEMVTNAQFRYGSEATFAQVDAGLEDLKGEKFDYVVASGLFGLGYDRETFVELVGKMYSLCRYGLFFNALTETGAMEDTEDVLLVGDVFLLQTCLDLTPWLVFRRDYAPHDATVFLCRGN